MYWPLGAPRSYAQQLPLELSQLSTDGTNDEPNASHSVNGVLGDASVKPKTRGDELPKDFEQPHQDDDEAEQDVNGPSNGADNITVEERIVCLCVARYGHIFATITQSSLTVWQTQVCSIRQHGTGSILTSCSLQ